MFIDRERGNNLGGKCNLKTLKAQISMKTFFGISICGVRMWVALWCSDWHCCLTLRSYWVRLGWIFVSAPSEFMLLSLKATFKAFNMLLCLYDTITFKCLEIILNRAIGRKAHDSMSAVDIFRS